MSDVPVTGPVSFVARGAVGELGIHSGPINLVDHDFLQAFNQALSALGERPEVRCVILHGGSARDHFIVVFKDASQKIWAVDPWPNPAAQGVVEITARSGRFSFGQETRVHLTADETATAFPCKPAFFGWFH